MSVGRGRKKGSRRRKIRISGQLRDFDELYGSKKLFKTRVLFLWILMKRL